MKNIILLISFNFFCKCVDAQHTGIHFEQNTVWEKVLGKAKVENKYIFIDCFTTWCGPCKAMNTQIFPLDEVGEFYNKNFINLKLQFDTTQSDDKDVKNWYATASKISKQFNVISYPTFLFFDSNGQIVHKIVGSRHAEDFIAVGKNAMDSLKRYYSLKQQYDAGKRDSTFLYNTIKIAKSADEINFSKKVCNEYLTTQKNIYTKANVELLEQVTNSSKDLGFQLMLNHPDKVDSIAGKGTSSEIVNDIILNEEVFSKINSSQAPNWRKLQTDVKFKYPMQAFEVICIAKVMYAGRKQDWIAFSAAVTNYIKHFENKLSPSQLNGYSWRVFINCTSKIVLRSALKWSKKSFAGKLKINPSYISTYANLLYKIGEKESALDWEMKAQKVAIQNGTAENWGQDVIDKMKKGEKTW